MAWSSSAGCGGDDDSSPRQRPRDAGSDARDASNQPEDAGSDAHPDSSSDMTAPVINLTGPTDVVVDCGGTYTEAGAAASDSTDGAVSVTMTGADQITTVGPGRFVITYSARDAAGNTSQVQRNVFVCGPACGETGKAPVNMSTWAVEQFAMGPQGNANWDRAPDGLSVVQRLNADGSILLSDFEVTDTAIEGGWRMDAAGNNDNDYVGFVFGYQDRGHFYLFDWKQATQDVAQVGMSLKVVNLGAFRDGGLPLDAGADADAGPDGGALIQLLTNDLWPTAGSENVQILKQDGSPLHNSVPWKFETDYRFFLEFHPGSFRITVHELTGDGGAPIELVSWSVQDSTYVNGKFGFYNYSQGPVEYTSFTRRDTPGACSTVRDQ
ncbi:MAG TPA: immunoglobulin-like domain-containing protein [Polyangiaceae bacterium]